MSEGRRRCLTDGEAEILGLIREMYGPANRPESVFFSDKDEAAIFVRTPDGGTPLMANLTFLADERREGASLEDIRGSWLTPGRHVRGPSGRAPEAGRGTGSAWRIPVIAGTVLGGLLAILGPPVARLLKAYGLQDELSHLGFMVAAAGWAIGLLWSALASREAGRTWALRALPLILANAGSVVALLMGSAYFLVFRRYDELLYLGFYLLVVVDLVALTAYAVFPATTAGRLDRWIGRRFDRSGRLSIAGNSSRALLASGLAIVVIGGVLAAVFHSSLRSPRFAEEIFEAIGMAMSLIIFHSVAAAGWLVVYVGAKRPDRPQLKGALGACWLTALAVVAIAAIFVAAGILLPDSGSSVLIPLVLLAFLCLAVGAVGVLAHLYAVRVLFSRPSRAGDPRGSAECAEAEPGGTAS